MLKKNKNILIILGVGIVLIVSMFFVFNKNEEYKELPRVKLKNQNLNSSLAIMVENNYQTGEYTKWKSNVFPTDGYSLNEEKSGCVDENGKIVDALTYNEDKTISIKTKQSVYCYVYYTRNIFLGNGSKESPYQINVIEDLVRLSNTVNDGETYSGKYFELMRNLNFQETDSYENSERTDFGDINGINGNEALMTELTTGRGWKPIGNTTSIFFSGILDGKNHRLDNLYIKNDTAGINIGLFGRIGNCEIKNLTLSGEITTSVNANIGAFVSGGRNLKMDNCINEVNITSNTGSYQVGGLVGYVQADSEITNCVNKGNISNGNSTAGIIANIGTGSSESLLNVKVENCENSGIITNTLGSSSLGGIVGRTDSKPSYLTIKNCKNYGLVTTGDSTIQQKAGGIMGVTSNDSQVTIESSDNYGEVAGNYTVGGLIGITNKHSCTIIGSSNSGTIKSVNYSGGLVGITSGTVISISESYNSGKILESGLAGGIIGYSNGDDVVTISKTYNYGNIEGIKSAGGLIDSASNNTIISESFNKGVITLNSVPSVSPYAGGLIGVGGGIVINSGNYGNVILNNNYTGTYGWGAWGIAWTGDSKNIVLNSFNIGNITINNSTSQRLSFSSGLVCIRLSGQSATVNNVYNSGSITGATYSYSVVTSMPSTPGKITINNTYYKTGLTAVNTTVTGTSTEMSDSNMKITSATNQNGLLYKLNTNVTALNKAGLGTIDSSLSGYTLCKWKIGTTGYPELDC